MESPRLSFLLQKCLEQMRSLHRHDADRKGFGHSPTSILNLDLKNLIQKIASWYQLALLASFCLGATHTGSVYPKSAFLLSPL